MFEEIIKRGNNRMRQINIITEYFLGRFFFSFRSVHPAL